MGGSPGRGGGSQPGGGHWRSSKFARTQGRIVSVGDFGGCMVDISAGSNPNLIVAYEEPKVPHSLVATTSENIRYTDGEVLVQNSAKK
jgi:hypothetical protein